MIDKVTFANGAYDVAKDADALVLITEWNEFRSLDLERLRTTMKAPVLVDLRNVYSHSEASKHGFAYYSIGRPIVESETLSLTDAAEQPAKSRCGSTDVSRLSPRATSPLPWHKVPVTLRHMCWRRGYCEAVHHRDSGVYRLYTGLAPS